MKKLTSVVLVLVCFLSLGVQAIERVYSGIVPDADMVVYLDGAKSSDTPFAKACEKFVKAHENDEWIKNLNKETAEQAKQQDEIKGILNKLGIQENEDIIQKVVGSGALLRDENGNVCGVKEYVIAFELKRALDMPTVLTVGKELLMQKNKRADVKVVMDAYKKCPMLKISLSSIDEGMDALRNLAILAADGKLVFFGTESGCKAAMDRWQSGNILDMDAYYKGMMSHDFFFGVKMFKELGEVFAQKSQEIPALATMKTAEGIALTMDVSDALYIDLRAALKTPEDAAALKLNLWDNLGQPMLKIYGSNLKQEMGGEFPLVDSFKGSVDGNVFKVGFSLTMKDIEVICEFIKNYIEMKTLLEAPVPDAPAPAAPAPAAPAPAVPAVK